MPINLFSFLDSVNMFARQLHQSAIWLPSYLVTLIIIKAPQKWMPIKVWRIWLPLNRTALLTTLLMRILNGWACHCYYLGHHCSYLTKLGTSFWMLLVYYNIGFTDPLAAMFSSWCCWISSIIKDTVRPQGFLLEISKATHNQRNCFRIHVSFYCFIVIFIMSTRLYYLYPRNNAILGAFLVNMSKVWPNI
jgi:hypothetical protein